MIERACTKCKEVFPLTHEFFLSGNQKTYKDGFSSWCRKCRNQNRSEWHKNNKKRTAKRMKIWSMDNKDKIQKMNNRVRLNNPRLCMFHRAKASAKRRNISFSLTIDDIGKIPEFCPILNIPLFVQVGQGRIQNPNNPSLDRIDNNKGYEPGNLQIISWRANNLKSDASLDEVKRLYEFMSHSAINFTNM